MNAANKLTILRLLMIPVFVALVLHRQFNIAVWVFIAAAITDALDGFVARTFNMKTEFGTMIDPLADKLLIISAFICLVFVNNIAPETLIPAYVPVVVIARDVLLIFGVAIVYVLRGRIEIKPSFLGKFTTFFQMLSIIFILLNFHYIKLLLNIMVIFTISSTIEYIFIGNSLLNEK